MRKTIAAFGASGKIGREVVTALLERGCRVTALQNKTPVPEGCHVIEGSIADVEAVRRTLGDHEIVLQFASAKGNRDRFLDVSVGGTFNVLDAVTQRGGCDQVVLSGGDCALGIWFYRLPEPLTEEAPLRAYPGYYPLSKVMEETLAKQFRIQSGVPVTVLRMGWVHRPDSLLKLFPAGNVAGRCWKHMFHGDMPAELQARAVGEGPGFIFVAEDAQAGTSIRRTTVSYRDVVQAWLAAIDNPLAINEVFNVVHPAWDYAEVGRFLSERLDVPAIRIPLDAHSWDMDTTKIRTRLGWTPEDDVFSMLDRALSRL